MKIIGIGVDIVENKRIQKLIKSKQFIYRVFTEKEIVNNTFDDLKLMPKQASEMPEWNIYKFGPDVPLKEQLNGFQSMDTKAYFWTVDSNVDTFDNWNYKFKYTND